jgi:AraC family transcriptional regulator of adaptative response / DNA-3-methyladenine glycosylase II
VIAGSEAWRPWRSYALMHLWNTLMPPVDPADPAAEGSTKES